MIFTYLIVNSRNDWFHHKRAMLDFPILLLHLLFQIFWRENKFLFDHYLATKFLNTIRPLNKIHVKEISRAWREKSWRFAKRSLSFSDSKVTAWTYAGMQLRKISILLSKFCCQNIFLRSEVLRNIEIKYLFYFKQYFHPLKIPHVSFLKTFNYVTIHSVLVLRKKGMKSLQLMRVNWLNISKSSGKDSGV